MTNVDLKKKVQEHINSLPEVESVVLLINDGKQSSAMVAGTSKDIINLLANSMDQGKEIKNLFELAYFALEKSKKD